jgi:hypothetical protein
MSIGEFDWSSKQALNFLCILSQRSAYSAMRTLGTVLALWVMVSMGVWDSIPMVDIISGVHITYSASEVSVVAIEI